MYKAIKAACWNMKTMRKNPRVLLCLLMGFLSAWFLCRETLEASAWFGTDLQMLEPFIWCFSDSGNILFASLALLLILTQLPNLDRSCLQAMFRVGRKNWIWAQIITSVWISFLYTFFLFLITILLGVGRFYVDNRWSDTATVFSYAGGRVATAVQVTRRVIKSTTPYGCALQIFALVNLYMLLLVLLKVAFTLRWGKKAGLCAALFMSLYGFLLTPGHFMAWLDLPLELQYYANLLAAWASPLQHASYSMHSFGYDSLPKLWVSYGLMGAAVIILGFAGCRQMAKLEGGYLDG